ncbi:hypothetical protein [Cloacibacterium sp.]|uniref:hypothetical protein n=1 Tax=Cloacibacterium sp. TaxID=1913682 RepID=UPI0039E2E67D
MKIKIFSTLLILKVCFLFSQEFGNFSNIENFFNLTKQEVEFKIKDSGYQFKSKDKLGNSTYIKKNSTYIFVVTTIFNGNQLKYFSWNDTLMRGQFIVNDIGNDSNYKIDESKTNDYLGIFTSVSDEKDLQVNIFKTQPNLQKGMIVFSLMKWESKPNGNVKNKTLENEKNTKTEVSSLDVLKKYDGKYPGEVHFLKNVILKKRLVNLIGNEKYNYMVKTWAVENNILESWGCEAHNCDRTNFDIVIDFDKDKLYIGYRVEERIFKFGEDQDYPESILEWEKENMKN